MYYIIQNGVIIIHERMLYAYKMLQKDVAVRITPRYVELYACKLLEFSV